MTNSSLSQTFINYDSKKFYNLGPRCRIRKPWTACPRSSWLSSQSSSSSTRSGDVWKLFCRKTKDGCDSCGHFKHILIVKWSSTIINKWRHSLDHHLLLTLESSFTILICLNYRPLVAQCQCYKTYFFITDAATKISWSIWLSCKLFQSSQMFASKDRSQTLQCNIKVLHSGIILIIRKY